MKLLLKKKMVLLDSKNGLLGMEALNFKLLGIDEKWHTLKEYHSAEILVIIFMCNHCPYVLGVIDRLNKLATEFREKNVQFIGINSNDARSYPDDSFGNMQEFNIVFPYLYDETQEVAQAYQAVCTPDIFVFDKDRKLAYHGRIDDNWKDESKVTKHELRSALEKLLSGNSVSTNEQFPSMGCSIKWK